MIAYFRLMRLYYGLPLAGGFIVILSYVTGGNLTSIGGKTVLSFFSLLVTISAGYVFNDVCDVEIDKINCPNRMLVKGKLRRKTALFGSLVLFTIGIVLGGFCGFAFLLVITAIAGLLIFYDLLSKKMGVFKDVLVAILMTSLYPLAFTLTESVQTPRLNALAIFPVWLFLSSLGYEMLKDIRDMKGDSQVTGRKSNYCQGNGFIIMSKVFIVAGSLIAPVPFILGYCKGIYFVASIAAVILAIISTFKKPTVAIHYIYAEIFLVTAGSMVDLLVFGP